MDLIVAIRYFRIWKLECWWIALDAQEFQPKGRKKLFGKFYWIIEDVEPHDEQELK